ncbi:MAG: flagellar biosynthesis anti-sigma factor FlgM [Acidobacteriota bacterium]
MEIYNNVENLGNLLGIGGTTSAEVELRRSGRTGAAGGNSASTDRATLSSAGNEAAQIAGADGVRADKVTAVQAALAAGTYSVPAAAVASKLVDAMLGGGR